VAGFSVEVTVPFASKVTFTNADVNTANPYIFGTLQSPPLSFNGFPNIDLTVSDTSATVPGYKTLNPGDIFGLAHVTYAVAGNAPIGPVTVSIVPAGTSLSDDSANAIAFTPANGTITISSVPEPSPLLLALVTAAGVLSTRLIPWRRGRQ
jgi:hypothetical protein